MEHSKSFKDEELEELEMRLLELKKQKIRKEIEQLEKELA